MIKKDLNFYGVKELNKSMLMRINGGEAEADSGPGPIPPGPSIWWAVASQAINAAYIIMKAFGEGYIKFSAETGGKWVFHHVQEP
jgi:hypothetical protein